MYDYVEWRLWSGRLTLNSWKSLMRLCVVDWIDENPWCGFVLLMWWLAVEWRVQNLFDVTLSQALGMSTKKDGDPIGSSKLSKVSHVFTPNNTHPILGHKTREHFYGKSIQVMSSFLAEVKTAGPMRHLTAAVRNPFTLIDRVILGVFSPGMKHTNTYHFQNSTQFVISTINHKLEKLVIGLYKMYIFKN